MSLDIYLYAKDEFEAPVTSGIFVRENGKTVELTEDEWRRRNPHREPVQLKERPAVTTQLYHDNITHNLNSMAMKAGLYDALWHPGDNKLKFAKDLIPILADGLERLVDSPGYFHQFNPENKWGNYEGLVTFVASYLNACRKWPDARIEVSI